MKLLVSGLLLLSGLSGCTPVVTSTTAFFVPEYKSAGTIIIVAAVGEVNNSLEFAHYRSRFEQRLASNGYTIVANPSEARYVAFVAYGIDEGKTAVVSTPIFGQTGGGTTYSSGTAYGSGGSVSYSGSSYTMPTYGVVGSSTGSVTQYTRAIALDIVDAASLKEGHPKRVLESRAKSTGSCSTVAGVFEEMLEAMFTDFPGQSGRTSVVPT
jgi:hypothetical protein